MTPFVVGAVLAMAVALACIGWLARHSAQAGRMDAMAHLRRIQADKSTPLSIRQAAERLTTTVTRRDSAPFTNDSIMTKVASAG